MKVSELCGIDKTLRSVRTARRAVLADKEMRRADKVISDLFDSVHDALTGVDQLDDDGPDDIDRAWGY